MQLKMSGSEVTRYGQSSTREEFEEVSDLGV